MEVWRAPALNILLANYEYPPIGGGAANATRAMAMEFRRMGIGVRVITSGLRSLVGTSQDAGVPVDRIDVGRKLPDRSRRVEMLRFLLKSSRAAAAAHAREPFDGAIAFFTIPSGPAVLALHRRSAVPYVVSLRGGDVPGHVPGMGASHFLTRPLRRRVLRHARAIAANSESLAEMSRRADPFPVCVVPNGVDLDAFRPGPPPPGRKRFRLLFVGRVHPEKNLKAVIDQMPTVEGMELVVAGDGAERPALQARAAALGVADRISWLGWQPGDALPSIYRGADALVNPSFYEGSPNVVLEAMASGLPVVASDTPGNRSVVEPDRTGLVFPLGDARILGAHLRRLLENPGWGQALATAARRRAERDFSWERSARSYLDLLGLRPPS